MWSIIISYLGLLASAGSEINFESQHVLTVCDAFHIWHTRQGEAIPECPQLPNATGFFDNLRDKLYEKQCDANVTIGRSETTLIERSVLIVKLLVDSVKDGLVHLAVSLISAAEDVSGLKSVAQGWNHRVYLILAGSCFLLYHLLRAKMNPLTVNILLGFLTSGLFYFVHLYYRNWLVTWLFVAVAVLAGSPLYPRTRLTGLGTMTFIHLAVPLLDLVLRLAVIITYKYYYIYK